MGVAIYLAFWFANGFHGVEGPQGEPDAEPEAANTIEADHPPNHQRAAVEPTPEGYVAWLIERCERRYLQAGSAERRALYSKRVTILYGLQSALTSELRPAALRSLAGMSGISDDESSPGHAAINAPTSLAQASRAVQVSAQTFTWCTMH